MTVDQFRLPDVGEGLTEAEISAWHVAVGDHVELNQPLLDIETAKSVVELPSPFAGVVDELLAAQGDTVAVGAPIVSIETSAEQPRLLVGYGPKPDAPARRRRSAAPANRPAADGAVLAAPPTRLLARELGVDLSTVRPAGEVITSEDVRAAVHGPAPEAEPGGEVRVPVSGVRRLTAEAMVASAFTAPHVTEFVTVDVTATMALRERLLGRREFDGVKLTPLTLVARAFCLALQRTPEANARWEGDKIVRLREVNLGIAAATPRGLVVPNVRSAQRLALAGLARAIGELTETARAGRTPPEAMTDGTATITNVGVFGVDTGTPILNPGETTILALGAIRRAPWVVGEGDDERIEPRWVTQLALSFDHRVLDGAEGSRVLRDTADLLHDPGLALAMQ